MNITATITSGALIPGMYVTVTCVGRKRNGRIAFVSLEGGRYVEERFDSEAGCMYHIFKDGHINGTPQEHLGIPSAQFA